MHPFPRFRRVARRHHRQQLDQVLRRRPRRDTRKPSQNRPQDRPTMQLKQHRPGFAEVIAPRRTPNQRFLVSRSLSQLCQRRQDLETHQERACRHQRISLLERQRAHRTLHQGIQGTRWEVVEYRHKVLGHLRTALIYTKVRPDRHAHCPDSQRTPARYRGSEIASAPMLAICTKTLTDSIAPG